MKTVREIMTRDVITIPLGESIQRAVETMDKYKISGLPVMEGNKLVGIVTSSDIRRAHPNRIVDDVMTPNPITIKPEISVIHAASIIKKMRIERLPVVENNELVGIITKSNIVWEIGKHIDALTGLKQSPLAKNKIKDLIALGESFSLIFVDLDTFSEINKGYGHVIGDSILVELAGSLENKLKNMANTALYRYGGDEFAIILETDNVHGIHIDDFAQDILHSICAIKLPDGKHISGSLGVITCNIKKPIARKSAHDKVLAVINSASQASTEAKKVSKKIVFVETEL